MKKLFFVSLLFVSPLCALTQDVLAAQPTAAPATAPATKAEEKPRASEAARNSQHYITDKLYAPLREGQSEKSKLVHSGIESGTAVTVLEKNDQNGYAKIRTTDNLEGWVRMQYLSSEPTASLQLEQANAALAQQQEKARQLEAELQSLRQMSSKEIDTYKRNDELVKQNQLLISNIEVLRSDNERLKSRNNQTWFFAGGGLVLLTAMLTLLFANMRRSRKSDGWA